MDPLITGTKIQEMKERVRGKKAIDFSILKIRYIFENLTNRFTLNDSARIQGKRRKDIRKKLRYREIKKT